MADRLLNQKESSDAPTLDAGFESKLLASQLVSEVLAYWPLHKPCSWQVWKNVLLCRMLLKAYFLIVTTR